MKKTAFKRLTAIFILVAILCAGVFSLTACTAPPCIVYDIIAQDEETDLMDNGILSLVLTSPGILDKENTYLALNYRQNGPDKIHAQIQTKSGFIGSLGGLLAFAGVSMDEMLAGLNLADMVDNMVETMFPGFAAKLRAGDLKGALGLIEKSLGFNIKGLDYENESVKALVNEIGSTMKIPADILERIPADTVLTLTFDNTFYEKTVEIEEGGVKKKVDAIYIGEIGNRKDTQPWAVFTRTTNADGKSVLRFRAEFMGLKLGFIER